MYTLPTLQNVVNNLMRSHFFERQQPNKNTGGADRSRIPVIKALAQKRDRYQP
jgi:hypothetical protein